MNLMVIMALLQATVALLTASVGTPAQSQALAIANQAIIIAQQASIEINQATQTQQAVIQFNQPVVSQPTTQIELSTPQVVVQPKSMTEIEIISPMANKGINRELLWNPHPRDESNYVIVGAVIRDENGVSRYKTVQVTSDDPAQSETINGTGDIGKSYKDGNEEQVYYYPFQYYIKTSGEHTITFSVDGVSQSVTFTAKEDTRN